MSAVAPPTPRPGPTPPAAPRRSPLATAIQAVILLLLVAILAGVLLLLSAVASLLNVSTQVAGGVGGLSSQAAGAVTSLQHAVQDATDPNHPPRGLTYDTEFSSLQTWHVGQPLSDAGQYVLSLQSIQRRPNADSPDTALYAVIHAELRQPRQVRLLGQVISSDSDPHDYVVYKGESFRIAGTVYRVNWISQAEQAMAAGSYRQPDQVTAPLKFDDE